MKHPTNTSCSARWLPRVALACALFVQGVSAQPITNYFTDGNGSDPTPLDQYPSSGGAGWLGGWASQLGSGAALSAGVSNAAPLTGSGSNYLSYQFSGGTAASTIRRQFSTVNNLGMEVSQPYVIEFDYRVDNMLVSGVLNSNTFNNGNDYISFSQNGATGADITGRATFWVKCQGLPTSTAQPGLAPRMWGFYEGGLQGTTESRGLFINSTNVPMQTNVTYRFKFVVDPIQRVYDGSVTDGVNTFDSFAATGRHLRWRNYTMASDAANLSNTTIMTFVGRNNNANEVNTISLDNLRISQLASNLWPALVTQLTPVKAQTFFPYTSNIVFTAQTFGTNRLPASGAQLLLNGIDVSGGLVLDGTDSSNLRTITYNGALKVNQNYEATFNMADQAGRKTSVPFFFDTFATNNTVTILETENYNFEPNTNTAPYCDFLSAFPLQTDPIRPDRYIQNWLYGGPSALDPSGATNVLDSYYARDAVSDVDFFNPAPVAPSSFRTCSEAGIRNSPGDEYERLWIEDMGINELINDRLTNGVWLNYTHEWAPGNYLVYLRVGTAFTNFAVDLHKVTSDYKLPAQTTSKLGTFILTNAPPRREVLKNYLPTDALGNQTPIYLSGKETLRLTTVAPAPENDSVYLNRMVFVPVPPPLVITNVGHAGSDFSFSINTTLGTQYRILTNSTVLGGAWNTYTTVTGNGSNMVIHFNPIGAGNLYFRAVTP